MLPAPRISTFAPSERRMSTRMVTSLICGRLSIRHSSPQRSAAGMIATAAFFAPLISTVPRSGLPPPMINLSSMFLLCPSCRAAERIPARGYCRARLTHTKKADVSTSLLLYHTIAPACNVRPRAERPKTGFSPFILMEKSPPSCTKRRFAPKYHSQRTTNPTRSSAG